MAELLVIGGITFVWTFNFFILEFNVISSGAFCFICRNRERNTRFTVLTILFIILKSWLEVIVRVPPKYFAMVLTVEIHALFCKGYFIRFT